MHQIDWDAEAAKVAQYVQDELMSAHRGAIPWRQVGISAVFGNDGYGSPKVLAEVDRVRARLIHFGIKILGFGTDPGAGKSWAMLVETDHPEALGLLTAVVWEAWEDRYSDPNFHTARAEIAQSGIRPDHSAN
jgi:hypothetical protein